ADRKNSARFDLARGRVALTGGTPGTPLEVVFEKDTLAITPPAGRPIGLGRVNQRAPGQELPSPPVLRIEVPEGEVQVEVGGRSETLTGPGVWVFRDAQHPLEKTADPPAGWVTESGMTAVDQQLGKQFATYFKEGLPTETSLLEAQEDDEAK